MPMQNGILKDNLVIVAGGLGSRLAPMTNHIPKFLVNTGKNTGYVEMIRYWKQWAAPNALLVTVIVHSAYEALTKAYHQLYFPEVEIIVKTVDEANGSAHAILSTCSHLIGAPAMITWCDVIPVSKVPSVEELFVSYTMSSVVFTNYNGSCRYGLKNIGGRWNDLQPALDPNNQGGIFGLYFVQRFSTSLTFEPGQDFVEVIPQLGKISEHRIDDILDFGDLAKLERVRDKADEGREFNSLEFIGDYVKKAATNDQGVAIIAKELSWYKKLEDVEVFKRPAVPKIWAAPDNKSFFMSKVEGTSIWKVWSKLSVDDRRNVLSQIFEQHDKLLAVPCPEVSELQIFTDIQIESCSKLLARYQEIADVIKAFGKVTKVNNVDLKTQDPVELINRLSISIREHYFNEPPRYGFIHGDLQLSNSLVDLNTMKVSIIDPRGYFGKTSFSGIVDYDIAKLLYSLEGYEGLNNSRTFGVTIKDGHLQFSMSKPDVAGLEDFFKEHFKPIHYKWLAVIFIGLAAYIKNDPVKSLVAHYHGMVLAEQWLQSFD